MHFIFIFRLISLFKTSFWFQQTGIPRSLSSAVFEHGSSVSPWLFTLSHMHRLVLSKHRNAFLVGMISWGNRLFSWRILWKLCAPLRVPQKSWDDSPGVSWQCAALFYPVYCREVVIKSAACIEHLLGSRTYAGSCLSLPPGCFPTWPGRPYKHQTSVLILNSLKHQVHGSLAVLRKERLKWGGKAGRRNNLRRCRIVVGLPGWWGGGNRASHLVGSSVNKPRLEVGVHIVFAGQWEARCSCGEEVLCWREWS